MLESFLAPGAQKLDIGAGGPAAGLVYGQSVTDACMDWDMTHTVLAQLARSARARAGARRPARGGR
jgi:3-deoxy-7-phosphoheptulonate synthase